MSFFFLLFLFFIGYFFIWPIIKGVMRINRFQSEARDFFNGRYNGAQQRNSSARQPQQPAPKKKKIDPSVGEYVEYEEITVDQSYSKTSGHDAASASTQVEVEQQIVDVEWEDIK